MNFSYTTNPNYLDLVCGMYKAIRWHYRAENWGDYTFPDGFIKGELFLRNQRHKLDLYYIFATQDFVKYYHFPLYDMLPIVYFAILFTVVRYLFEIFICTVCF